MMRDLARASESVTTPRYAKDRLGNEVRSTAVGHLMLAIAIRGLWSASRARGCSIPSLPPRCAGDHQPVVIT